ncbi:hypothetical protein Tco_1473874 [Tanacetum coccineum]
MVPDSITFSEWIGLLNFTIEFYQCGIRPSRHRSDDNPKTFLNIRAVSIYEGKSQGRESSTVAFVLDVFASSFLIHVKATKA